MYGVHRTTYVSMYHLCTVYHHLCMVPSMYGVHTVSFLAGESPSIRSYTVHISVFLFSILNDLCLTSRPNFAFLKTFAKRLSPFMPSPLGGLRPPSLVRARGIIYVSGMALKQQIKHI